MKNYIVSIPGLLLGLILFCTCSQNNRKDLGTLQTGEKVFFVPDESGLWGIKVKETNAPEIYQPEPAKIEIFRTDGEPLEISKGYYSIKDSASCIAADAKIEYNDTIDFSIHDLWSINESVISVKRSINVSGNVPGGFNSSVTLNIDTSTYWDDVKYFAPGALYGNPAFDGERSPGGPLNNQAKRFLFREDMLPAPLFALSFTNGSSIAILNPSPNGASTVSETRLIKEVMTDERIQLGALGAWQNKANPVEFGYMFPCSSTRYSRDTVSPATARWYRRYHPIKEGVEHAYEVRFRFGSEETFKDVTRNTWRWAWNTLDPEVMHIDVDNMRTLLTDHLVAQAATIDGRTAIPFAVATFDTAYPQWNWTMAAMGFVSKNIECADQLLRESDRDSTQREQYMRETALNIISSMINALPTVPLQATGYDLATGKPWDHIWLAPWLRNATEDMRVLIKAYQRERKNGHVHPEWFNWVKTYVDWLILQQREDGSFPRRWERGSDKVAEATGTASYCPVPLLVLMTEETGDERYKQAAIQAAEYIWNNWGKHGLFVGGTSDNPNITDKEAGMLSLEAFLSLYESTHENKWLERAQTAADFTESWIYIWNIPMPLDADNAKLHWKKGVPTIGLQGISARTPGGVDEYLDWSAPSFAKLYKLTNDEHYLAVARLLLNNTKSMVAVPGNLHDMKGIGWQQENWSMATGRSGRGVGGHRFWLPWISVNHLHSITGLEEFDRKLYEQLAYEN